VGYISTQFFKKYSEGNLILGDMFGEALIDYINTFDCMTNRNECKTVQTWTLLGDPSLMIGGYS
jgi:hypothetical protein